MSYVRGVEKWVSNYWGEDPLGAPPGIFRAACVRDWEFVSKGTEISLGKFVSEYFTSLTLDL